MKISYSWPLQPFTLQTITFVQYPVSNKASYVLERTLTRRTLTHWERSSRSTHQNRTSHPRDDHPPLGTTFWGVFWLPSSLVLAYALTTLRAHTYTRNTYIYSYVYKVGWGGVGGKGLRDGATVRGCWCVQSTPVEPRARPFDQ